MHRQPSPALAGEGPRSVKIGELHHQLRDLCRLVAAIHVGNDVENRVACLPRLDAFQLEVRRTSFRIDHRRHDRRLVIRRQPPEPATQHGTVIDRVRRVFGAGKERHAAVGHDGCVGEAERHAIDVAEAHLENAVDRRNCTAAVEPADEPVQRKVENRVPGLVITLAVAPLQQAQPGPLHHRPFDVEPCAARAGVRAQTGVKVAARRFAARARLPRRPPSRSSRAADWSRNRARRSAHPAARCSPRDRA